MQVTKNLDNELYRSYLPKVSLHISNSNSSFSICNIKFDNRESCQIGLKKITWAKVNINSSNALLCS